MAIRNRTSFDIPFDDAERPARDLRGGKPMHHVCSLERVSLQFPFATVGVCIDDFPGGQGRQGNQGILAPGYWSLPGEP
jgi:hypothetical protein